MNVKQKWILIVIKPYQNTRWFWEYLLLIRRLAFIVFINITYLLPILSANIVLLILLIAFWFIHYKNKPFLFKQINDTETLCLSLSILIMIIITFSNLYIISSKNNNEAIQQYVNIINAILSIFIIIPIIALLFQVILILFHYIKPDQIHPNKVKATNHSIVIERDNPNCSNLTESAIRRHSGSINDAENNEEELSLPTIEESKDSLTLNSDDPKQPNSDGSNSEIDAYLFYDEPMNEEQALNINHIKQQQSGTQSTDKTTSSETDKSPLEYFQEHRNRHIPNKNSNKNDGIEIKLDEDGVEISHDEEEKHGNDYNVRQYDDGHNANPQTLGIDTLEHLRILKLSYYTNHDHKDKDNEDVDEGEAEEEDYDIKARLKIQDVQRSSGLNSSLSSSISTPSELSLISSHADMLDID